MNMTIEDLLKQLTDEAEEAIRQDMEFRRNGLHAEHIGAYDTAAYWQKKSEEAFDRSYDLSAAIRIIKERAT